MNHYLEAFDRTIDRLSQPGEIFEVDEVDNRIGYSPICVFGLSDDRLGEVVAEHLNDKVYEENLRAHLSKQLAAFKLTKYIFQREKSQWVRKR